MPLICEASVHKGQQTFLEIVQTMPARTPDHSPQHPCPQFFPTSSHVPAPKWGRSSLLNHRPCPPQDQGGCLQIFSTHCVFPDPTLRLPECCDKSSSPSLPFLEPLTGEGEVKRRSQGSTHESPWEGENRINFAGGPEVDGTETRRNGLRGALRECEERWLE